MNEILTALLHPHFTNVETEAESGYVDYPGINCRMSEAGFELVLARLKSSIYATHFGFDALFIREVQIVFWNFPEHRHSFFLGKLGVHG